MIIPVLQELFPDWEPPKRPRKKGWTPVYCPSHEESRPSASISLELDSVKCHACGFKGTAVGVLMKEKGITKSEAIRIAESFSDRSDDPVPQSPPRVTRRWAPGEERPGPGSGRVFSPRIR